jgi:hypothetical protein
MIEWMKTLPQDAEVECGVEVTNGYSTYMNMVSADIESCNVIDCTGPAFEKYPHVYGKVFVEIRGE